MLSRFGLVLGLLVLFLAACDLFLAPRSGRFNPSDPNADPAEHLIVDRAPKEDVYVDTAPSIQFGSGSLYVNPGSFALMRFDLTDLPDFITWAELTLYNNTASVTADIAVHRILKPWDPATVSWSEVNLPDVFYAKTPTWQVIVDRVGDFKWHLTAIIENMPHGVLIIEQSAGPTIKFTAMEGGSPNWPRLNVLGYSH